MRPGRTRALLASVALVAASAAPAQELTLPRDEARAVAVEAARAGDDALARSLAAGLLAADPDDRVALLVLATVEPELGRPAEARRAGARAWRLSETGPQRYEAARLTASAAAEEGNFWLAGLWLRLALAAAPDPAEAEATRADAAALRPLQRWRTELGFSVAPSANVNGGATSRLNRVDDFPFDLGTLSVDTQALSGWLGSARFSATYRLRESPVARTRLTFGIGGSGVLLSGEAKAALEADSTVARRGISAEDFSNAFAEIGLEHDRAIGPGVLSLAADLGRRWPGGEGDYDYAGLGGGYSLPLGAAVALQVEGSHEWRDRPGQGELERAWGARVGVLWAWSAGDTSVVLSYGETDSEKRNSRNERRGLVVSHAVPRPLGPAHVSLSAGYEITEYPDYGILIFLLPRRDETVSGSISAAFPDFGWAGFEPVVRLDGIRNDSNYSRFDTRSLGIGFEIRSSF